MLLAASCPIRWNTRSAPIRYTRNAMTRYYAKNDFQTNSGYSPYLGAGPALLWRRPDFGSTDTSPGVNVLGGVVGKHGDVRPFVQMKGVFADQGQVALVGGLRF